MGMGKNRGEVGRSDEIYLKTDELNNFEGVW